MEADVVERLKSTQARVFQTLEFRAPPSSLKTTRKCEKGKLKLSSFPGRSTGSKSMGNCKSYGEIEDRESAQGDPTYKRMSSQLQEEDPGVEAACPRRPPSAL
ncbi:hypothetical protein Acr_20g0003020 [Actinidia rufa]|uniref:Uncharacterized protein n=1 Tax=Actinidia rufa TaxID=165716 RepID=A0A7J0GCI6_9ERIC|nr:hypothetical protein Acr_20g0003020 [Actinidia rufa]